MEMVIQGQQESRSEFHGDNLEWHTERQEEHHGYYLYHIKRGRP
jgi:hypothetical protein